MTTVTTQASSQVADPKIPLTIAKELGVGVHQVSAAVALLDEGATVPFIARYRKEATGNLDDTQLRSLEERLSYLRELEERRAAVLASIEEQGKLTDALRTSIEAATTKQAVEDLYLPFKPKRRTRATIAREAGLEPLADSLLADPLLHPEQEALKYILVVPAAEGVEAINVPDAKTALEGARDILTERFSETAELLAALRTRLWDQGVLTSTVMKDKETAEAEKFRDYYAYAELIKTIPSHRALALFRGRALGVLKLELGLGEVLDAVTPHPCVSMVAAHAGICISSSARNCWCSCVKLPRLRRFGSLPVICTSCCWRRRQGRRPFSAWILGFGPVVRWRWWMRPGSCWRQRRSIRISLRTTGRARWRRLCDLSSNMVCN
jgi:uncharacterized protein